MCEREEGETTRRKETLQTEPQSGKPEPAVCQLVAIMDLLF